MHIGRQPIDTVSRLHRRFTLRYERLEAPRVLSGAPQLVKDINVQSTARGGAPEDFLAADGAAFFTAETETTGRELWTSDGGTAGTVRVKDIRSGTGGSYLRRLTNVDGTLYCGADEDGDGRQELWNSNGAEAGTVRVKVFSSSGGDERPPDFLTNVNGVFYFTAGDRGSELWKSDGTAAGTFRSWPTISERKTRGPQANSTATAASASPTS